MPYLVPSEVVKLARQDAAMKSRAAAARADEPRASRAGCRKCTAGKLGRQGRSTPFRGRERATPGATPRHKQRARHAGLCRGREETAPGRGRGRATPRGRTPWPRRAGMPRAGRGRRAGAGHAAAAPRPHAGGHCGAEPNRGGAGEGGAMPGRGTPHRVQGRAGAMWRNCPNYSDLSVQVLP
jgi:hypothetical protein